MRAVLVLVTLLWCCSQADGQGFYKCQLDGKLSYTDAPCPRGVPLAVAPAPPARSEADDAAQLRRQQLLVSQLARERHKREDKEERVQQREQRSAASRQRACAKLRLHKKWADDDLRRATPRKSAALTRKAQRSAEALALSCPG